MLKAEKYRKRDIAYMFHNLLLVMSLSGSAVLAVYLLVSLVAHKYVFLKWQYRILKMRLFFICFRFQNANILLPACCIDAFRVFRSRTVFYRAGSAPSMQLLSTMA